MAQSAWSVPAAQARMPGCRIRNAQWQELGPPVAVGLVGAGGAVAGSDAGFVAFAVERPAAAVGGVDAPAGAVGGIRARVAEAGSDAGFVAFAVVRPAARVRTPSAPVRVRVIRILAPLRRETAVEIVAVAAELRHREVGRLPVPVGPAEVRVHLVVLSLGQRRRPAESLGVDERHLPARVRGVGQVELKAVRWAVQVGVAQHAVASEGVRRRSRRRRRRRRRGRRRGRSPASRETAVDVAAVAAEDAHLIRAGFPVPVRTAEGRVDLPALPPRQVGRDAAAARVQRRHLAVGPRGVRQVELEAGRRAVEILVAENAVGPALLGEAQGGQAERDDGESEPGHGRPPLVDKGSPAPQRTDRARSSATIDPE